MSSRFTLTASVAIVALAVACGRQSASPVSPSASVPAKADAAADGSTLKISAPTPSSPLNDQPQTDAPTLVVTASTPKFGGKLSGPLTYRFQVFGPTGAMVADSGQVAALSYRVTTTLQFKTRHTWRARAEYGNDTGPWSATGSFISSQGGYVLGSEVFDPLVNGTTVGQASGPVTFTADGARLEAVSSYVRYAIPLTINSGEFAMEIKGLRANASGDKSKVFGMMQGNPDSADYITNPYRVDVQYRGTGGSPPNSITYRVLYGSADDLSVRYEPTTDQRLVSVKNLDPNTWYYWRYTWGKTVR